MKFDLIVSFVTFIWLTDPIGTFEMVYNEFLNPGGLFVIGDLAYGQTHDDVEAENKVIFALKEYLVQRFGHRIISFVNCSTGSTCVWIIYKPKVNPIPLEIPFDYKYHNPDSRCG